MLRQIVELLKDGNYTQAYNLLSGDISHDDAERIFKYCVCKFLDNNISADIFLSYCDI